MICGRKEATSLRLSMKDWKWTEIEQAAFDSANAMLVKEAILSYPNVLKPFEVHINASDFQLGAVISQDGKPIAYYPRKLNSAQRNYTVGEMELLGIIVKGLKAFENILQGQEIIVHTDHLNILYAKNASQRIVR